MNKVTKRFAVFAAIASGVVAVSMSAQAALMLPTQNCSYVFTKNTKRGSTGTEVMNLQKVLNMFPETRIASSGAGSPGNETSYFGPATTNAVIKFQNLHNADILTPAGLPVGNGNVYGLTRAVLNQICVPGSTGGNTGGNTGGTTTNGSVSVALGNTSSGVFVEGQAGATLANFVFTGNGTVTNLELMRTGVSTNNTLRNVYLFDGAVRLTDSASVSQDGKVRFNTPSGLFTVNGSKTITIKADIDTATANQYVGVQLSSYTVNGQAAASTLTGPQFQIANVTDRSMISLTNNQGASGNTDPAGGTQSSDANRSSINVWDVNASISNKAAWLKGITFKYVGSAPLDAVQNLNLYVDGVKVSGPAVVTPGANGFNTVVFDLRANPYYLMTGTRNIQLRGDIVKGSDRTFQFSVQNSVDYVFEDSNLQGVNVSPTIGGNTATNVSGYTFSVRQGSITTSIDPNFTEDRVVGGAANATISKFKFQAYGEDVKVETLVVGLALTSASSSSYTSGPVLQNVAIFANGAAVGSTQNFTGTVSATTSGVTSTGNLTYNLGSSLIIPAGTTVIVEVRADTRGNSGAAYTSGQVRADIVSSGSIARGQVSQTSTTLPSTSGRTLDLVSANATFAKTSSFNAQTISPSQSNVVIGSFSLQNQNSEDVRVTNIDVILTPTTMTLNNIRNLRVTDSNTGSIALPATTTSFSMDVTVSKNTVKTFLVTADIDSATGMIQADARATYRGVSTSVSNTSGQITGAVLTVNTGTLATTTKVSSSPVSQLVVGESTNQKIVDLNFTATGGSVTIQELGFTVAPANAIKSISVGGQTLTSFGGTMATVTGLNINVPLGVAGVDIPVTVTYGSAKITANGGIGSATTTSTAITLTAVKYISSNNPSVTTAQSVASNGMQLVASKPVVTVPNVSLSGLANTETKIGEVTVSADAKGNIKINKMAFDVTGSVASITASTSRIADGSTTINGSACTNTTSLVTCTFGSASLTDNDGYTVTAGTSKTFSIYATVSGVSGQSGTASISTKLDDDRTTFSWDDVEGGVANLNLTNHYDYPTGSYSVKN